MDTQFDVAALLVRALEAKEIVKSQEEIQSLLEVPKDTSHGDWAFPCFTLARELRKAPQQIAEMLAEECTRHLQEYDSLSAVAALGPYLNFEIRKSALAQALLSSILSGEFLQRRLNRNERVMVEYSQPNTHKAFHVGHTRNAALGDSIARLYRWCGYDVLQANYLGDEGTHVAKCLWYFQNHYTGEVPTENLGEFLGDLYVKATELLDLSLLTRVPYPGVIAAKVLQKKSCAEKPELSVVVVTTGESEKTVLTGGKGFAIGDIVPFALPGTRVADRQVTVVTKFGVESEGMICSDKEIALSEDPYTVTVLPQETPLGELLVELYRTELAPAGQSVRSLLESRQKEVGEVLSALESGQEPVASLWKETKQWSLDEFEENYRWLDCHFDEWFFESQFGEAGKQLVREYQQKGVFREDDGAVGADLNEWGLGFCLLIKRNGTALYSTRDLVLAQLKFEKYQIDRSIYVVDAAQTLHFQQVFKCLELMGYAQAKKCYHQSYAQVVTPDGKMSSRKGNVILFSELKKRLHDKIQAEYLDKYVGEWSQEEIAEATYRIALATVRYGMLKQDNNSQIVFDLDEWTSRTGNTGPYMMYAYARIRSILREFGELDASQADYTLLSHPSEVEILLHLNTYGDTVIRAAEQCAPNLVCAYVYELAKRFNRMYQECSVLKAESERLKVARASLITAVSLVLAHGLNLLGIKTVERM